MTQIVTTLLAVLVASSGIAAEPQLKSARKPVVLTDYGRQVHQSGLLFDGHNDLAWQMRQKGNSSFDVLDIRLDQPKLHTDINRLKQGGVNAQFWSVYVPAEAALSGDALLQTLQQIELVHSMVERYPDVFEMAETANDVERIAKSGKIASMLGIEGGYSIESSLGNIQRLYDLGCRYMTLTHSKSLEWADSATDEPISGGLSEFGKDVIREMNRVGMLVDLSHVSANCMRQALSVTAAPVIFSHSSARAITDLPRNVPDDVLKMMPANGGVVMVNFYSKFVIPTKLLKKDEQARGSIHDVVDHIEHIIYVAGIDHVGLGSDFDGVPYLPAQLQDVSTYPLITQELLNRGYPSSDIHKLLGGNILRTMRMTEAHKVTGIR